MRLFKRKSRVCGGCVVCCVYPSVDQNGVKKEALAPCNRLWGYKSLVSPVVEGEGRFKDMPLLTSEHYHLPGVLNCKVYDSRPKCCSDYHCAWLDGYGKDEDRPDKCGIVVDRYTPNGPLKTGLIAKPLWYGAEDEKRAITAMKNISRSARVPLLVLQFTEFRLLRVIGRGVR